MSSAAGASEVITARKWALDWALKAMGGVTNGNVWSVVDAARVTADFLLEDLSFHAEDAKDWAPVFDNIRAAIFSSPPRDDLPRRGETGETPEGRPL